MKTEKRHCRVCHKELTSGDFIDYLFASCGSERCKKIEQRAMSIFKGKSPDPRKRLCKTGLMRK